MTDLSIFTAAAEAPDAIGLLTRDRAYTFAELAAAARAIKLAPGEKGPVPIVAHRRVDTVVHLYALIATGVPALLLHPRLADAQRRAALATFLRCEPTEGTLAILLTSGSTGAPKGVELSRAAFFASATASEKNLGWQAADRWLCALPLAHVGGLSILTRCLLARKPVILDESDRFTAGGVIALAKHRRATLFSAVPTMLGQLADHDPHWHRETALRAILVGGAHAPRSLLRRLGDCPVSLSYGMTETCAQIAATRPTPARDIACPPGLTPLAGIDLRTDDRGRIFVRGPTLLTRYLPDETRPGAWLATGDIGSVDERGQLIVHGRADDVIITGGENVHPRAVEEALLAAPGIAQACVFGVPDPTWGAVVAAAVAGNPASVPDAIRAAARNLATHERPRLACKLDAIPLGPTGKIDRAKTIGRARGRLVPIAYEDGGALPAG